VSTAYLFEPPCILQNCCYPLRSLTTHAKSDSQIFSRTAILNSFIKYEKYRKLDGLLFDGELSTGISPPEKFVILTVESTALKMSSMSCGPNIE